MTDKVEDLRSIDIAWLRRKGARNVGYSGTIRWSRGGAESAAIGCSVVHGGLRLTYRHSGRQGEKYDPGRGAPSICLRTTIDLCPNRASSYPQQ
jgi:hypothetical protein